MTSTSRATFDPARLTLEDEACIPEAYITAACGAVPIGTRARVVWDDTADD